METLKPQRNLSAGDLLTTLKWKIMEKLNQEPWEDEQGNWHDPLDTKSLAAIGNFLIKLQDSEDRRALQENGAKKIQSIPALPPIK